MVIHTSSTYASTCTRFAVSVCVCGDNGVDRQPRVRIVQCREAGVLVNLPAVSVETVFRYDNASVCRHLSVVSVCLFFVHRSSIDLSLDLSLPLSICLSVRWMGGLLIFHLS